MPLFIQSKNGIDLNKTGQWLFKWGLFNKGENLINKWEEEGALLKMRAQEVRGTFEKVQRYPVSIKVGVQNFYVFAKMFLNMWPHFHTNSLTQLTQ
jgi:hypothetical protein